MPDKVGIDEAMIFNLWLVNLKLLDLGIPWHKIQTLSNQEIAVILGVSWATEQRKAEQQAQEERQASRGQHLRMGAMRR